MSLPLPTSLSPSKVASFKECALAFRFSAIDRLPEPPSPWAAKGTLVHRVLELLFWEEPQGRRTLDAALGKVDRAWAEVFDDPEYAELPLTEEEAAEFRADAELLVRRYFDLEDPNQVRLLGTELRLEESVSPTLTLRGIIDRFELDYDGDLDVTDFRTGQAPWGNLEQNRQGRGRCMSPTR